MLVDVFQLTLEQLPLTVLFYNSILNLRASVVESYFTLHVLLVVAGSKVALFPVSTGTTAQHPVMYKKRLAPEYVWGSTGVNYGLNPASRSQTRTL